MNDKDGQPDEQPSKSTPERTPQEQALIDKVAERRGREFAAENVELILAQARLVGEL